jgi:hypothetical protein
MIVEIVGLHCFVNKMKILTTVADAICPLEGPAHVDDSY